VKNRTCYTTGEAARILDVAPRTVCKWCAAGRIACHRLPGSTDRRIEPAALRAFATTNGFPPSVVSAIVLPRAYAVALTRDSRLGGCLNVALPDGADLALVADFFRLGWVTARRPAQALLIDAGIGRVDSALALDFLCSNPPAPSRAVVLCAEDDDGSWLPRIPNPETVAVYRRPCDLAEVAAVLTALL
jgi:excisionase family DNA binding protein